MRGSRLLGPRLCRALPAPVQQVRRRTRCGRQGGGGAGVQVGAGCRVQDLCGMHMLHWPSLPRALGSLPPRHALFQRRLAHRRPDRQRAGHPGGLSAGGLVDSWARTMVSVNTGEDRLCPKQQPWYPPGTSRACQHPLHQTALLPRRILNAWWSLPSTGGAARMGWRCRSALPSFV